jgi:hypothetical protein
MYVPSMNWSALWRSCLVALLVLRLVGGDFGLVQMGIWTKMIIERSQISDLKTAIATTFDGQHPCEHCHALKKAHQSDDSSSSRDQAPTSAWKSLEKEANSVFPNYDFFPVTIILSAMESGRDNDDLRGRLLLGPPTPPPRSV